MKRFDVFKVQFCDKVSKIKQQNQIGLETDCMGGHTTTAHLFGHVMCLWVRQGIQERSLCCSRPRCETASRTIVSVKTRHRFMWDIYHFASLHFLLKWDQHLSLIRLVATVSLQWIQGQQTQQLLNDFKTYIRNLNMTGLPFLRQRLKLSVILALPLKISSMSRSWSRPDKMLTKTFQCLDTNWANVLEILVLGHGLGSTWSRKHPHPSPQSDTRNPPSVSSEHIRVVGLYQIQR